MALHLTKYISSIFKKRKSISILEPSCGDGVFINAIIKSINGVKLKIDCVEIDGNELDKVKNICYREKNIKLSANLQDYLEYHSQNQGSYDLIIGNPPYIEKKKLTRKQLELGHNILVDNGIETSGINNIWEPFLIGCVSQLNESGVLCFILPIELLQVSYAARIRGYIKDKFDLIEIIHFSCPIYVDILQDVIAVIGYKKNSIKGIREVTFDNFASNKISSLETSSLNMITDLKWTSYLLDTREIELFTSLRKQMNPISDYCTSTPGIVTGNNNFFILNSLQVKELKATKFVKKIIRKSSFIKASIVVSNKTFNDVEAKLNPCYLLDLNGVNQFDLSKDLLEYIVSGESKGYSKTYKCKKRENWTAIPNIKTGQAVFFKRSHKEIKLMLNPENYYFTDTAYIVDAKVNYDIDNIVFSFYNSFTMIAAELYGRYYGGGVLELIPSEFKSLPIKYISFSKNEITQMKQMLISDIIKFVDSKYGFPEKVLSQLSIMRNKLIDRRVKRRSS